MKLLMAFVALTAVTSIAQARTAQERFDEGAKMLETQNIFLLNPIVCENKANAEIQIIYSEDFRTSAVYAVSNMGLIRVPSENFKFTVVGGSSEGDLLNSDVEVADQKLLCTTSSLVLE